MCNFRFLITSRFSSSFKLVQRALPKIKKIEHVERLLACHLSSTDASNSFSLTDCHFPVGPHYLLPLDGNDVSLSQPFSVRPTVHTRVEGEWGNERWGSKWKNNWNLDADKDHQEWPFGVISHLSVTWEHRRDDTIRLLPASQLVENIIASSSRRMISKKDNLSALQAIP